MMHCHTMVIKVRDGGDDACCGAGSKMEEIGGKSGGEMREKILGRRGQMRWNTF